MNKIIKRLLTGVLTLATVFTALPTTAVYAAETQYWTESAERVGVVERVNNDVLIRKFSSPIFRKLNSPPISSFLYILCSICSLGTSGSANCYLLPD